VIRWGEDVSCAESLFLLACRKLLRGTVSLIPVGNNDRATSCISSFYNAGVVTPLDRGFESPVFEGDALPLPILRASVTTPES
jgi:hypothetical protein